MYCNHKIVPYTYVVVHKKTGFYYYGVRMSNTDCPCNDLWKKYYTSSKYVNQIIEAEGTNAFDYYIRKLFDTKESAALYEYGIVKRLYKNDNCLNQLPSPVNTPGNWFTNGKNNLLGKYCPDGYWSGRTLIMTENYIINHKNQKKRKWWTNGVESIHNEICPDGWYPGRTMKTENLGKAMKNTKWWNNGQENYRGIIPPNSEWVLGRLKFTRSPNKIEKSQEQKTYQANKIKGRKHYTNGIDNVFGFDCPNGFYPGRTLKPRQP